MNRNGLASSPKNTFGVSEWNGAVGDLGTLLPLAFALVVFNGYPISRLFLLWGAVYVLTGYYFKIPVSVQPLKAMTVIAITMGMTPAFLSSTAFFYGLLMLVLVSTGLIGWLQHLFSRALIRGIQLGIGLMLGSKAIDLVLKRSLVFGDETVSMGVMLTATVAALFLLFIGFSTNKPVSVFIILSGILMSAVMGFGLLPRTPDTGAIAVMLPDWRFLPDAILLLIIPQLPLTLGNSVYAANDACHEFWPNRSQNVKTETLVRSIGWSNVGIGLFGGFPVCHGAGGIAAHARFGAKTGGATIILGSALMLMAVVDHWSAVLFLIPVPILGALLLLDSWALIRLMVRLPAPEDWLVAAFVGITAYVTRNLTLAVLAGLALQKFMQYKPVRKRTERWSQYLSINFRSSRND